MTPQLDWKEAWAAWAAEGRQLAAMGIRTGRRLTPDEGWRPEEPMPEKPEPAKFPTFEISEGANGQVEIVDLLGGRPTSSADRSAAEAAAEVLGRTEVEHTGSGAIVAALTSECARSSRVALAELGVPVGEEARWSAFAELTGAAQRYGWPTGPHRFTRAAEIVARARAADQGLWTSEGSQQREEAGVRVLLSGVDTLELGIHVELLPEAVERLDALRTVAKRAAKNGGRGAAWVGSGPYRWEVSAHAPHPYSWMLVGPAFCWKLARPSALATYPGAYLEIKAAWLRRLGPDRAVAEALTVLRRWCQPVAGAEPKITVSRIDLAADVQGLVLTGAELNQRRWVTCAKKPRDFDGGREGGREGRQTARERKAHAEEAEEAERSRSTVTYHRGHDYTGNTFGPGARVMVRIYDKTRELKRAGGAVYLPAMWAAGGYVEGAQVWRIEAQIRGEALRQMVLDTPTADGRMVRQARGWPHKWANLRRGLGALWRYCVGAPGEVGGWISLRAPTAHARPCRWPVDPSWIPIQRVTPGASAGADRILQTQGRISRPGLNTATIRVGDAEAVERGAWQEGIWQSALACQALVTGQGEILAWEDAGTLAEVLRSPELLKVYGTGPDAAARVRLELAGVEVPVAEQRAENLRKQAEGTLAAWIAHERIARGHTGDPVERLAEVLGALDPDAIRAKVAAATVRSSLRGALALGRQIVDGALAVEAAA